MLWKQEMDRDFINLYQVVMPDLGEGIEGATVACWYLKEGDLVNKDDDLLEVVTDKATFNVSSNESGRVKEIFFKEGQEAKIGTCLATIEVMA